MSWHRQVKTLYTISFQMLTYICWTITCNLLYKIPMDYKMFIMGVFGAFFTQYICSENKKKIFAISIPFIVLLLPSLVFYKEKALIFNLIYILISILFTLKLDEDKVDYHSYKDRIKKSSFLLVNLAIVCMLIERDVVENIFRFYILYLILCIIVLRESRSYHFNIKEETNNKNSFTRFFSRNGLTNIAISLGVILLSLDSVFGAIKEVTLFAIRGVSFVLDKIIFLIVLVLGKPLEALTLKLRLFFEHRISNTDTKGLMKNLNPPKGKIKQTQFKQVADYEIPGFVYESIKLLALFLVMFIIYKIVSNMISKLPKDADFTEEKEKITKEKTKEKDGVLNKLINNIFSKPKTINEQILNVYKKFEEVTDKSKIYKTYMTATQLKNITKIHIDDVAKLDDMTDIYNETKFSNHKMEEEHLKTVKSGYKSVKKQL